MLGSMRTLTLIHLNLFVRTTVSGFWRTASLSRKSTEVFAHEAPEVHEEHPYICARVLQVGQGCVERDGDSNLHGSVCFIGKLVAV